MGVRPHRIVKVVDRAGSASSVNHDQVIQFVVVQIGDAHDAQVFTVVGQTDVHFVIAYCTATKTSQ